MFEDSVPGIANKHSIKSAISAYKSLQYDSKIELIRHYQAKIDKMLVLLEHEDTPSQIDKITKAIDSLRKNILALEQEVSESVLDRGVIKGDMSLTFLEDLMSRKKRYEAVIAKK